MIKIRKGIADFQSEKLLESYVTTSIIFYFRLLLNNLKFTEYQKKLLKSYVTTSLFSLFVFLLITSIQNNVFKFLIEVVANGKLELFE